MPRLIACVICLCFIALNAQAAPAAPTVPGASAVRTEQTYDVTTRLEDWTDAARDGRVVPIKVYFPVNTPGPRPVILFSHGLGGSREAKQYLGEFWASHGYVCVHMQHKGSDESIWRDVPPRDRVRALKRAIKVPANSINRPLDVTFVIDQLEKLNRDPDSPWHNRLDLEHIGLAGHSYGAFTTVAIAGQVFSDKRGREFDVRDPRVDAVIAMSPQAPKDPAQYDLSFAKIKIPVFYMTGTKDTSMIQPDVTADDRRVAYDHTPGPAEGGPDVYLVTFTDGDHMIFSDKSTRLSRVRPGRTDNAVFHPFIKDASLAFWNAYLMGDEQAKAWLRGGGFAKQLGDVGVFEVKPGTLPAG